MASSRLQAIERNDPTFAADLANSAEAVWVAARWLWDQKWTVRIPPILTRPSIEQREEYSDDGDLFVIRPGGSEWECVAVKHRPRIQFTGPKDWPYSTMFVDAVHCWLRADPKPVAYIIVSRDLNYCAIVRADTVQSWQKVKRLDRFKQRNRDFYECPLDLVRWCDLHMSCRAAFRLR